MDYIFIIIFLIYMRPPILFVGYDIQTYRLPVQEANT